MGSIFVSFVVVHVDGDVLLLENVSVHLATRGFGARGICNSMGNVCSSFGSFYEGILDKVFAQV